MDVGAELQKAREQRGLSLQDISNRTKISLAALHAIENNDAGRLPGGIFTRGFVKSYAREVGLEPADTARRYAAQFEPPPPPPEAQAAATADASERALAATNSGWRLDIAPLADYQLERGDALRATAWVVVLALVAASYFLFMRWATPAPEDRAGTQPPASLVGSSADETQATRREETATTGSSDAVAASSKRRPNVLRIELQSRATCWVSAAADGSRVMYRLMQAGDRETFEVRDEAVLRVGEPSNLGFAINGRAGALLGRPGQPATVRITPLNYEAFLAR